MKKWNKAEIVSLDINFTASGDEFFSYEGAFDLGHKHFTPDYYSPVEHAEIEGETVRAVGPDALS